MPEAPEWMRRNARRGLAWYEAGFGGDGLTERTVAEARAMARGDVSDSKVTRMNAWFARHMQDIDGVDVDTDPPTPGMVAHALWGGWPRRQSERAQRWARDQIGDRSMDQLLEQRHAPASWEVRESPDGTVGLRGYAAVFDSESYREVVRASAFNKTLADGADVRFLINHDGVPLARTKSGTMTLSVDDRGLLMDVEDLDMSNPRAQELVSAIRRGDVDQMSFAFIPVRDAINDQGVRELLEVRLMDVSAVTFPWYEATSIAMADDDARDADLALVECRDNADAESRDDDAEPVAVVEDSRRNLRAHALDALRALVSR